MKFAARDLAGDNYLCRFIHTFIAGRSNRAPQPWAARPNLKAPFFSSCRESLDGTQRNRFSPRHDLGKAA